MSELQRSESHGTPHMEARPVDLPCQGPACNERVVTYLTDEDVEAHETVQVFRYTPEIDDERLVQYWFCSSDCRATFVNAVESGERPETLYDE
ncbi:hypothetical protein MUK72_19405 (plasmid) [Halococcus dombrowskii]|jgi:hypothetical protein|uniref:YHS domain-containing protein n=1 Tax=Halococcus dombrowskii TaxID=179637 RepID=A0AAV3SGG7_HALDO|nr:hypothetical protein [Halococcus dombrowskii]UOO97318.1 hypothetical protein MUK72_19405 [Halococcus dombrowskii]